MTDNPYDTPKAVGDPPRQAKRFLKPLFQLLGVVAILALVVAFFLPATRRSRVASVRVQCKNNLRQIALALWNYESEYGSLPPAYTVDAEGRPLHSWRTLLLPFIEESQLYGRIDLTKPWDDPANDAVREADLYAYRCPGVTLPKSHTTYVAILADDGCFPSAGRRMRFADISDTRGLTLLVLETTPEHAVHWMSPNDTSEVSIAESLRAGRFPHPGVMQVVTADGMTLSLSAGIKPATLRALISIAGRDDDVARLAD
jgi:type II secretory pathway pseudopilin PulG